MSRTTIPLEVIDIPNPCPVEWNEMRGDERVRFCRHCSLHVYNLSEMTRDAAEALVAEREGRLCVRFLRRADGTVITRDCENAWKRAAKRASRLAGAATALALAAVLSPLAGLARWTKASPAERCEIPKVIEPPPRAIMGDVVNPPPVMGGIEAPAPFQGKPAMPAQRLVEMRGEMAISLMGAPVPLPPPATQPAATQPAPR
jgi:hypothetical protein